VTIDIDRLPRRELNAGRRLYRIHRAVHGAWYFSNDGRGRFDPTASPNRGACYFAENPLGAWVEAFRTVMTLAEDDVHARVLSTVELPHPIEVVDLTNRHALAAGVTAAVTAGGDYAESQQLASALAPIAPGLRWRVRHDLEQTLIGVALFGRPGAGKPRGWPEASTQPIGAELIRDAETSFGYRVVPTP